MASQEYWDSIKAVKNGGSYTPPTEQKIKQAIVDSIVAAKRVAAAPARRAKRVVSKSKAKK